MSTTTLEKVRARAAAADDARARRGKSASQENSERWWPKRMLARSKQQEALFTTLNLTEDGV